MRILKTILLILIYQTSFGQDTIMYLHSWKKPNKIDKISNDVYINIDFNKNDTLNKVYPKSCGGVLLFVLKDKIIMSIDNEELEKKISNGTTVRSSNNYSLNDSALKKSNLVVNSQNSDKRKLVELLKKTSNHNSLLDSIRLSKSETIRAIDIQSINTISYSKSKKIANVGVVITTMSGFAALVVAPLASINYKTGNFNQQTYYSFLAGCGIGFAVGIPLSTIFTKHKNYNIKEYSPDPRDNNYYSIQTK